MHCQTYRTITFIMSKDKCLNLLNSATLTWCNEVCDCLSSNVCLGIRQLDSQVICSFWFGHVMWSYTDKDMCSNIYIKTINCSKSKSCHLWSGSLFKNSLFIGVYLSLQTSEIVLNIPKLNKFKSFRKFCCCFQIFRWKIFNSYKAIIVQIGRNVLKNMVDE